MWGEVAAAGRSRRGSGVLARRVRGGMGPGMGVRAGSRIAVVGRGGSGTGALSSYASELVDERAARGLGGAWRASSSRWSAPCSPICRQRTSISGSLPRSRASVGKRLERRRGWIGRRSPGCVEESPDSCPRKACSDDLSNGWTMFRDGHGAGSGRRSGTSSTSYARTWSSCRTGFIGPSPPLFVCRPCCREAVSSYPSFRA